MFLVCFTIILSFYSCNAVIYHLNDTEYDRMPPLYGLDDYSSCLVPADGTYCLVRVDLLPGVNDGLLWLIHEYSENTIKHYNHTYIQRGVCVTSTCKDFIKNDSIYVEEGLIDVLGGCLNESIFEEYGLQAEVTELYYCERTGQHTSVDIGDWIVISTYIIVLVINVIGTLYDVIIKKRGSGGGNIYILSFSIIQNWDRLVSAEKEDVRSRSLTGLHGIRVFTLFLMFTSHIMWINTMGYIDNTHDFELYYETTYYQFIFNGLVVIQVFFVISGFLLVYNLEIYAEKHTVTWGLAAKVWIMRWWRLTPSYAFVLAFMSTWLRHLGSGPLWKMFVEDNVVADCRQYWWAHLLYINNYIDDGHYCALQTWHVASDTQLFCIGLLAYLLTKHGGRYFVLGFLVLLGVVLPAAHVWLWDLDGLVLMTPEFFRTMINDTFHYMYAYGHNNLVSYALGMSTGYFVYHQQKKGFEMGDNKIFKVLAWFIIPTFAALFYSGSMFYRDGERSPLALRMIYAAVQRLIVAVVTAFGVVGLALKLKSSLRRVFEWRGWVVPSRLSYSVYLLHMFLIHIHIGVKRHLTHASTFNMTLFHFGVMMFTFMIALPFCLMVEAPLMRLMKVSTGKEEK